MYKSMLFNGDMVRAILDGRKTQTRRLVKPQPFFATLPYCKIDRNEDGTFAFVAAAENGSVYKRKFKQPYNPGDILWVRETWGHDSDGEYLYKADDEMPDGLHATAWHPSIHMPKTAARIFLRVKSVHLERLQDARDSQCMAEGVTCPWNVDLRDAFAALWDSTIKPAELGTYGWIANPWVWAIEFERCEKPERWCGND